VIKSSLQLNVIMYLNHVFFMNTKKGECLLFRIFGKGIPFSKEQESVSKLGS